MCTLVCLEGPRIYPELPGRRTGQGAPGKRNIISIQIQITFITGGGVLEPLGPRRRSIACFALALRQSGPPQPDGFGT